MHARAVALLLTVASAVAYPHCFPTHALRWLAWVVLVPFLLALGRTRSWRDAALLAWVWSVVAAYGLNDWFPRAVSGYFLQHAAVGWGFFFAVSTAAAVPYMAFAVWHRALRPLPGPVQPLVVAAGWVAAELARTLGPLGDPWALLGYSQAGVGVVLQVADLAGVHGMTFPLAAANAALAARPPRASGIVAAAAAATLVVGYGAARLSTRAPADARGVAVAVVQGNLDPGSQWRDDLYGVNLEEYLGLSADAIVRARPALVVWPESAVTFFLDDEPAFRSVIARHLAVGGAELLTGGPRHDGASPPRYFNAAFLVGPDGGVRGRYDKQSLLPFAEYFPLRVDVLRRRFGRVREFSPGGPAALLPTAAGPAGVVICNEALFPGPVAARVRDGAALLVVLANDSWLGDARYAEQAFDMAVVRAVEQRRFLVRASTSGPSAVVDPAGRVLARSAFSATSVIGGAVEARSARTVYGRAGDAFAWGCVAVAVAAVAGRAGARPAQLPSRSPSRFIAL